MTLQILIITAAVLSSMIALKLLASLAVRNRLSALSELTTAEAPLESTARGDAIAWTELNDRLGRAGYWTHGERAKVKQLGWGIGVLGLALGAPAGFLWNGTILAAVIGGLCGLYLSAMGWLYYLRWKACDYQRELLFQLPITLESLVLLVESGLGVLPAIAQLVQTDTERRPLNPATRVLEIAYRLSASGMPFSQALESIATTLDSKVMRHVLLHLDISSSEGGTLAPAIRSLSDHCHSEWRLSVETRVRRLENLVVFPVFISVLGLLLLTAAVPLVPLVEFAKSLNDKPPATSRIGSDSGARGE